MTLTAEETAEEDAVFLADCTKSFHYIERDGLEGEALFKAVYADKTIGFIGEQIAAKPGGELGKFYEGSRSRPDPIRQGVRVVERRP